MFGLMGAHRTGKTTLARKLAKKADLYFYEVSTSEIMKEIGFNPVKQTTLEERIEAQEHLLLRYLETLDDIPRPFVADRTPIDMAAYMLAEVSMHNTSPELGERIEKYVQWALNSTASVFDTLIVTRLLEDYEERPDKPPNNVAYQLHIQALIEGMAYQMLADQVTVGFLTSANLEHRLSACMSLVERRTDQILAERMASRIH